MGQHFPKVSLSYSSVHFLYLPTQVEFVKDMKITSIACGKDSTIFITGLSSHETHLLEEGKVYGCGSNESFQLGFDQQMSMLIPTLITAVSNKKMVSAAVGNVQTILLDGNMLLELLCNFFRKRPQSFPKEIAQEFQQYLFIF